ncbi:hypothetical protein Lal_00031767 [Lupinus albus]|nr:hypothetical protein Lal_00031767 [Lupinus albus]
MRRDPKVGGGVGRTCEVTKNQTQHSPRKMGGGMKGDGATSTRKMGGGMKGDGATNTSLNEFLGYEKLSPYNGRFIMSPLMKGQVDTIGIAMRRVLLGEIEGTCITRAKSEKIPHKNTN